jgi:hypothetical protein
MTRSTVDRGALLDRYATGFDEVVAALDGASEADLDRHGPTGWSARQVVHHLADSETMAATRVRRLVADDDPVTIQGYDEPVWAERLHYDRPVAASLALIGAVRAASHELVSRLTPEEWERSGVHTEGGAYSVDRWLEIYADHCHEHADQIRRALRGED